MKGFLLLTGALLLISCAALPPISPPADSGAKMFACPDPYFTVKNRFIHAIEVRRAGQAQTVMVGVTLIDPALRSISCALVSTEGMSFLEASLEPDGFIVSRALPPFDSGDFARNMMDDIGLIFLAPRDALIQKGISTAGAKVCRHKTKEGWIDVAANPDGRIQIRRYSERGSLKRSVTLASGANPYAVIDLHGADLFEYELMMTLIESETVRDDPPSGQESKGPRP